MRGLVTSFLLIAAWVAAPSTFLRLASSNEFLGIAGADDGFTFSEAEGVDDSGKVVVGSAAIGDSRVAFRWTPQDGAHALVGTVIATDVSGDGSTIVGRARNPETQLSESFRYNEQEGLQLIGALPGGTPSFSTGAYGTSGDGTAIVGTTAVDGHSKAFRWTSSNGVQLIALSADLLQIETAAGVSDDGNVVVGSQITQGQADSLLGYRWTAQAGFTYLGTLGGFSDAQDVSPDGTVVVGQSASPIGPQAYRWSEESGMVGLGLAVDKDYGDTPFEVSLALGASRAGKAIVGQYGVHAFVWTEAGGMETLERVLADRFGLGPQLAGWTLDTATAISPDARILVGSGKNPTGQTQAWLVRLDQPIFVPEPAAGVMIVGALVGAMLKRRRTVGGE